MKKSRKFIKIFTVISLLFGTVGTLTAVNNQDQPVYAAKKQKIDSQYESYRLLKKKNGIPQGTVYIGISKNSKDYAAAKFAIEDWNSTGDVKLTAVKKNHKKSANIRMSHAKYGKNNWLGRTTIKPIGKGKYRSQIDLNDTYLDDAAPVTFASVAEHELGHALGLGHYDLGPSVMNSGTKNDHSTEYYLIQDIDVAHLKQLYHEK